MHKSVHIMTPIKEGSKEGQELSYTKLHAKRVAKASKPRPHEILGRTLSVPDYSGKIKVVGKTEIQSVKKPVPVVVSLKPKAASKTTKPKTKTKKEKKPKQKDLTVGQKTYRDMSEDEKKSVRDLSRKPDFSYLLDWYIDDLKNSMLQKTHR